MLVTDAVGGCWQDRRQLRWLKIVANRMVILSMLVEGQPDSTMQDIVNMDCPYIEKIMYIQGSLMSIAEVLILLFENNSENSQEFVVEAVSLLFEDSERVLNDPTFAFNHSILLFHSQSDVQYLQWEHDELHIVFR